MDPKRIVQRGYDRLGWRYHKWVAKNAPDVRTWFLGEVLRRVPHGAKVLELGCGPGVEAALLAYAFNHVPRAELAPTFRRVFDWLRSRAV
jgi:hypothetical protein